MALDLDYGHQVSLPPAIKTLTATAIRTTNQTTLMSTYPAVLIRDHELFIDCHYNISSDVV